MRWLQENLEDMVGDGSKILVFTQFKQKEFGGADWLEEELSEWACSNSHGCYVRHKAEEPVAGVFQ